jgi:hypothetical protein
MSHHALKVVTWKEVKADVAVCNPALHKVINQIPGVDNLKCVRAGYPFGHNTIREGEPQLPLDHENRVVELYNLLIPQNIRQLLDYPWQHYPVGLLLSHNIEINFNLSTHIAPVKMLKPGMLLAIHNILKTNMFGYTQHGASFVAGTNSLFMLPKVSHELSNQRLTKAFKLEQTLCPKTLSEQSYLFNHIVKSKQFKHTWYSEVLLFSAELMAKMEADQTVRLLLMNQALQQNSLSADTMFIDLIWSLFCNEPTSNVKPVPLITETAKHLVKLMMGRLPGFAPAVDDSMAPITQLMDIFINIYRMRYYLPVFMQPAYYDNNLPLYYSLQKPAFLHPYANDTNSNRTITMLTGICDTMNAFKEYLSSHKCPIPIDNTPLSKMINTVELDYFHPQGEGNINSNIQSLVDEDPRFTSLVNQVNTNDKLEFPIPSAFFNGCIRIRPAKAPEEKPMMREFLIPMRGMRLDDGT